MIKKNYLTRTLEQIPRLLTQMDRRVDSPTYGCLDREYWHYKQRDFPCTRNQEACLTLAILYGLMEGENPYYHEEKVLKWCRAGMRYWASIQGSDGSFDEWWPNEHSFVATSFSTLAMLEALKELEGNEEVEGLMPALIKSVKWIGGHDEALVSNQYAGSTLALLKAYKHELLEPYISGSDLEKRIDTVLGSQSVDGYFKEYDGFDVGYNYVTLDYLARIHEAGPDALRDGIQKEVRASADKLIEFLSYFVHPDGSVGRYYTTRQTGYMIPSGLEYFSDNPLARSIADVELRRLSAEQIIWDDRYLTYQLYYHLLAFKHHRDTRATDLPFQRDVSKTFPETGLKVESSGGRYTITNMDTGDRLVYQDGRLVSRPMLEYGDTLMNTPNMMVLSRLYGMTLGRFGYPAKIVKEYLRKRLIMKNRGKTSIYVPSSNYYHENDLMEEQGD
ncbi:hypothetical protein ACFLRF_01205 [Candidatus Altiarchaeota archaeon]